MTGTVDRRPLSVTLATALVYLYGLATVVAGGVIVWFRNNEIADIPITIARLNSALPFDGSQDDWVYVAGVGVLVALVGVLITVLAVFLSRGSRLAHVLLLLIAVGLMVIGVAALRSWSDQFALWGADGLLTFSAMMALVLILLILMTSSRRYIWGRGQ